MLHNLFEVETFTPMLPMAQLPLWRVCLYHQTAVAVGTYHT